LEFRDQPKIEGDGGGPESKGHEGARANPVAVGKFEKKGRGFDDAENFGAGSTQGLMSTTVVRDKKNLKGSEEGGLDDQLGSERSVKKSNRGEKRYSIEGGQPEI